MRRFCHHWLETLLQATQSIRALAKPSSLSLFSEILIPRIRISPFTVKTKNFGMSLAKVIYWSVQSQQTLGNQTN